MRCSEGGLRAEGYLPARRRWIRVRFSSLRCFFFAIRLRRFLMTEPTLEPLASPGTAWDQHPVGICVVVAAVAAQVGSRPDKTVMVPGGRPWARIVSGTG